MTPQTEVRPQASPRSPVRQPVVPKIVLPTEKTSPTLTFETSRTYLYGHEGVGKTTFAVAVDPERTLLIATEPGYGAQEAYVQTVASWSDFRELGGALAAGKHQFTHFAVDTVDELHRMCSDHVCSELKISHPADLDYGKGWAAVGDEFKLRVGKLCSLGAGVTFISHAKDEEIKQRVGTVTKTIPTLSGATAKWLGGFVDFIFLATIVGGEDGEHRVLRTQPSENWMAKQRIPAHLPPLPDPLPLDAATVRAAMAEAFGSSPVAEQADEEESDAAAAPKEEGKAS